MRGARVVRERVVHGCMWPAGWLAPVPRGSRGKVGARRAWGFVGNEALPGRRRAASAGPTLGAAVAAFLATIATANTARVRHRAARPRRESRRHPAAGGAVHRADPRQMRHSALIHAAEDGASTSMLLALSAHTNVKSLAIYTEVSAEALARWRAENAPAR
jgi:hypothetical protein